MAIALEGRLRWRQTAPFHVQLELEKTHDVPRVPSVTRVQGRAIRVFRTDGRLAAGDHIAFGLWVCREGDEPTGPAYIYYDEFMRAIHMEAYLHGNPPECELAAYEFSVIDAPSEQPTLTVGELEELLARFGKPGAPTPRTPKARRWWQFWKTCRCSDTGVEPTAEKRGDSPRSR
jgi:hypothetical protein